MQYELITDKHREWLKNKLNTTFEEIDNMSEKQKSIILRILSERDHIKNETK